MLTMRMPSTKEEPSSDEVPVNNELRRDLVIEPTPKARYYGQLLDVDIVPFEIAIADSSSNLERVLKGR
jgi:hypothetical protein